MIDLGASDLFLSTGTPPQIKIEGLTGPLGDKPLKPGQTRRIAYSVMRPSQIRRFEAELEMNLGLSRPGIGRFRINVYRQRGEVALVVRFLRAEIPTIEQLRLPLILKSLVMEPRGLIILVGATGCGKSTTLAAMIDHRNRHSTGHIITVEDPIEYLHEHDKCVVDQREVGLDTLSYENALKNALREAPDVLLIGEVRDRATMQHALNFAETGHLVLTTLHATNANQALDRILNFFPKSMHRQLLYDLSFNLRAMISQRLVVGTDCRRIPATELLLNTPYAADLIREGNLTRLKQLMENGSEHGMQTFDQCLFEMYRQGQVNLQEALKNADSRNNLRLRVRLAEHQVDSEGLDLAVLHEGVVYEHRGARR